MRYADKARSTSRDNATVRTLSIDATKPRGTTAD
jgi:hypothetical protein